MTLGAATLTGCGLFDDDTPKPDPDLMQPVLDEARALAARYDQLAAAQPTLAARLTPLGDDHKAHITELARLIETAAGPAATAGASAPAVETTLSGLRAAERAAQQTAVRLARTAPADRAALLGSIAASRASHAEALR